MRIISINLVGTFNSLRYAAAAMTRNDPGTDGERGVIVNTASMGGLRPMPGSPVYAATKAGVVNFPRSLAYLHEEANVRVNAASEV